MTATGVHAARASAPSALTAALRTRVPAAAALDPEVARDTVRDWLRRTRKSAEAGDIRVHDVLYHDDGSLSLRYSTVVQPPAGGRDDPPREMVLLLRVRDGQSPEVHEFPDDPSLPTLRQALDPSSARTALAAALPGAGRERGVAAVTVRVVHHPRSGACVLRYDLRPGAAGFAELPHPTVFAKTYPRYADAARAGAVLRSLGPRVPGRGGLPGVRLPRCLAVVPDLRAVVLDALPGGAALRRPGTPLAAAGRGLAALHAHRPRGVLPEHRACDELARLDVETAVVSRVWPDVAARVRDAVAGARRLLETTAEEDVVVSHGDFTPSQVLLHGPEVALVDLDTACWADPALDAGRFLAYLDSGLASGRVPPPREDDDLLGAYAGAGGRVSRAFVDRVTAYRDVALARMALSCARKLKDARLDLALHLLADHSSGGRP